MKFYLPLTPCFTHPSSYDMEVSVCGEIYVDTIIEFHVGYFSITFAPSVSIYFWFVLYSTIYLLY